MIRSTQRVLVGVALAVAPACSDGGATNDGSGATDPTPSDPSETDDSGTMDGLLCEPGETRCSPDANGVETCANTGRDWELAECDTYQECRASECVGPCELAQDLPSSAGCSFIGNAMLHHRTSEIDAFVVANPNDVVATLQLYRTPVDKRKEEVDGPPLLLDPGESWVLPMERFLGETITDFRTGGTYRVESDYPIVAYQHSPLEDGASNDSSTLLPEVALRGDYVVISYPPFENPSHMWEHGVPSYFTVIGIEDGTTVEWTPPVDTDGDGQPVPYVYAGETGVQKVNRFDRLRIAAASGKSWIEDRDVSGTVVRADKPIWVMGAVKCAYVPVGGSNCDHLQELMWPLHYWGRKYVGAPSVDRGGTQDVHWRVYAGSDDMTVTTEPPQPNTPIELGKVGDWVELTVPAGTAFVFESNRPFLPVQYISTDADIDVSAPSMYQMVPVEQFLSSYAFATALSYDEHYVQVIRSLGGADVRVGDQDGEDVVTGYYTVGDYEVADWPIDAGYHTAKSDDPFGIVQQGYTTGAEFNASYAYPGGLKVEVIHTP